MTDERRRSGKQGSRKQGARGSGASQSRGGGRGGRPVDDRVAELAGPLAKVLERLPETQRRVLELRMGLVDGHAKSLTDTARELGITPHETKEIEQRAFEHIREVVPLDRLTKLMKGS